jgi:hypothetical protein
MTHASVENTAIGGSNPTRVKTNPPGRFGRDTYGAPAAESQAFREMRRGYAFGPRFAQVISQ